MPIIYFIFRIKLLGFNHNIMRTNFSLHYIIERRITMQKFIYADNAATTKIKKPVLDAMMPYLTEEYGNPSSIYSFGSKSKQAVEAARENVAKAFNCTAGEIYFTGCGTEADNYAIKSVMDKQNSRHGKNHIITTVFEHHAVLHTCEYMQKHGYKVTYLPVDENGYVTAKQVKEAITDKTGLVSIMYANNEIGTIQPIAEIGKICKENNVIFHTDAVQAVGNVEIDVKVQNIDLLTLSAHKLGGPKGVGALYMRKGIASENLLHGGAQEKNKRAGTENVAGIVGLGVAIKLATENIPQKAKKISELRDYLIENVLKITKTRLNGGNNRLCGNANFSFEAIEGESLLLLLDMNGIAASSGSACTSGSLDPSHVLLAIGLPHEIAHGSLRISINEDNTKEEMDYIIAKLPDIVDRLRAMSPIWNG